MQKYMQTKTNWSGFYMCSLKHNYYSDLKLAPVVLPVKKGVIFNPEYQHTTIVLWTKLDLVKNYYSIKKAIRQKERERSFRSDLQNYKIFNLL